MYPILSLINQVSSRGNSLIANHLKVHHCAKLAPSHGDILAVLYKHKKVAMQDIAKKIFKTKATVTVLIDKLEKMGFVTREKTAADSRITYICLSEKGRQFETVFKKISHGLNQKLYKNFTKEELRQADYLLKKILKNIEI